MNLTSEFDALSQKGYLVSRQVINPTIVNQLRDYLVARLDRLREQFREWSGGEDVTTDENYRYHSDKIAEYEAKDLPKDLRHFLRGEFDLETRLSPEIRQLMTDKNLLQVVALALGELCFFWHYPPMLRFKIPHANQALVPPHQDSAYSYHIEEFVTVWLPFTNITDEVGGVIFYEGTQDIGKLKHCSSGAWESKALFDEQNCATHSPTMEPGDVLFFKPSVVHASGANISNSNVIRYSIDMRAFSQTVQSPKSYYNPWSGEVFRK